MIRVFEFVSWTTACGIGCTSDDPKITRLANDYKAKTGRKALLTAPRAIELGYQIKPNRPDFATRIDQVLLEGKLSWKAYAVLCAIKKQMPLHEMRKYKSWILRDLEFAMFVETNQLNIIHTTEWGKRFIVLCETSSYRATPEMLDAALIEQSRRREVNRAGDFVRDFHAGIISAHGPGTTETNDDGE